MPTVGQPFFPNAFTSYSAVPNCVVRMTDLTSDAKLVYGRMFHYGNDEVEDVDCDPSHARLARELGMTVQQVVAAITLLAKRGMVAIYPPRNQRERTIYEALVTPRMAAEQDGEGYGDDENL